jgi:DNA-binding response OmpR family regulator
MRHGCVKDDALLAMHLSAMLSEQGYRVLGPLRPAIAALDAGMPDAAVLDIDLTGVMSFPWPMLWPAQMCLSCG